MRLTLATLLLMASSPTWGAAPASAGDLLVAEPSAAEPSGDAAAKAPTRGTAQSLVDAKGPPPPWAAIYDAPVFGRAAAVVDKVDETALRFYAAQKNRTRVEAEIRRLRALHPAWKVPANLYATGLGNDEQPLWELFSAGRIEELRFAVQAREKREPGWRPSADLLAKMARQETAAELVALSTAKEWTRLLDLAAAHPDILACGAIDLDWRVAEAFAGLGQDSRAYEMDAAILKECRNRDERLATVRKAVDLLPGSDVEKLIAMGQPLADGSGEFDAVRLDLARRRLGHALSAGAGGTEEVPDASLKALGEVTLQTGDAADAALLAWYHFGRQAWADADGWFKVGLSGSGGDAKLAEGHALSLSKLGRVEEAERLAYAWRERSPVMRALFLTLVTERIGRSGAGAIDAAELADFTALLVADRSVPGAQALAWADYGRQDWDAAALWFGRAVEWVADGAAVPDKLVEGYGLTLRNLGRYDAAEDFLYRYRDRSSAARDLYVSVAVAALSAGVPGQAEAFGPVLPGLPQAAVTMVAISPERMDRFAEVIDATRSVPGAAAMGWRNLRDGRAALAVDWFRSAAAWSPAAKPDLKTLEGLVLALKSAGQLAEAEDASYPHIGESAQLREAYRGIMVAQLTSPALSERLSGIRVERFANLVAAESSAEGAQAIGWYRLQDGDCGYGTDWLRRAIAWSPDQKGTAKSNEGYAQALQRSGRDLAGADVALAWSGEAPDMKALYIKIMVEALTRDLLRPRVTEPLLERFADVVRAEHSMTGAQALAWYRYRDAGQGYGVQWFADAVAWSPDHKADAKTAEGYASALRDVGRLAEAEAVLYPWVDKVVLMRDLYIDTVVSELTLDNPPEPMPHDRLARFIAVATPLRSAAAAQAIGWYRFARREYADSVIWFKLAVDWWPALPADADRYTYIPEGYRPLLARLALKPEDYRRTPRAFTSRAHESDAALHRYVDTFGGLATTWTGYALALRAVGRTDEAEDIAFAWRDRWPMLGRFFVDLAIEALTRPAGAAPIDPVRLKRYAAVIEEEHDAGGAAAFGWAASARSDWTAAAVWLKAATDWRAADSAPDPKVVAGYVDALRQAGRPDEAAAAVATWAERLPELKGKLLEAAIDVLDAAAKTRGSQAPAGGNDAADPMAAERLAKALEVVKADPSARAAAALGWYFYETGQSTAALPLFKAAIAQGAAAAAAAVPEVADRQPSAEALAFGKAVEGYALTLRALGRDADALTFVEAWSSRVPMLRDMPGDIVADLLGHETGHDARPLAPDLLARLGTVASRARSVPAAAAFGWYAYGQRDWGRAANWFASGIGWLPAQDRTVPVKLVEGYAASLHNQCRFAEAETVALTRMDRDDGGPLRRLYVDSVSGRISGLGRSIALARNLPAAAATLAPDEARRFASAILSSRSENGAQALGWYSYRSRQYAAAAAWFEKAVSWGAREGDVFGLALAYRRLGDAEGLSRLLSLYGGRYRSLDAIRRAGFGGADPATPDFRGRNREDCSGDGAMAPDAALLRADATGQAGAARDDDGIATGSIVALASPAAEAAVSSAELPAPETTERRPVTIRRMTQRLASAEPDVVPEPRVHPAIPVASTPITPAGDPAGVPPVRASSGSAAAALAAKAYARCLAILDRRPAAGRTSADRETEGWCLLGLDRPAEAAVAFRAAGNGTDRRLKSDSALGETLSHLKGGDTAAAVATASRADLDAGKRQSLGLQILAQQALDAYRAGRWSDTLDLLRRRSAFATAPRDLVMLRGWALYQLGDYDAAREAFGSADRQLSDHDSRHALAVTTDATTPKALR